MTIDELLVADPVEAWRAAGFSVDDDAVCRIGTVRIRLIGRDRGTGIVGWSLRDLPASFTDAEIDGIPTAVSATSPAIGAVHPNGVTHVDHVVLMSSHLDRTLADLGGIDLLPRRERDGELNGVAMRQVFFRLGEVVLEVVGTADSERDEPSRLWGLTHTVVDIDASAAFYGEQVGRVRDAVQPGRRITTMRHRDVGLSVRTALISA